jgi:hypothetical protein
MPVGTMARDKKHAILFMVVILIFLMARGVSAGLEDHWARLHPKLTGLIDLVDRERKAPDSSWNPFKEDRKSIRKEMQELVGEAIDILRISNLSSLKAELNRCRENIRTYTNRIGELKTKRLLAPADVSSWKVWKKGQSDYDKAIRDYELKVKENEACIEERKAALLHSFREVGLVLEPGQLDALLFSITGDNDIDMITVFHNIRIITEKLRELAVQSGEDIEAARRYYGMYAVLLRIMLALQQEYVRQVDDDFLPLLDRLLGENQALMEQTRILMRESEDGRRAVYSANLESQMLTDKTGRLYRDFLAANRARMQASIIQTRKEYDLAENTYNTVRTAYNLIAMIQNSEKMFESISQLQVPELLTFENKQMKEEFQKLTTLMIARSD